MQFKEFDWLSGHGILAIIPCLTNVVRVRVNFWGRFYFHFTLVFHNFEGFLIKQLFYSRLVGYHLISNARSWNNCKYTTVSSKVVWWLMGFIVLDRDLWYFSDVEGNSTNKCFYAFSFLVGKYHKLQSINVHQTLSDHNTNRQYRVRFFAFVGQPLSKQLCLKCKRTHASLVNYRYIKISRSLLVNSRKWIPINHSLSEITCKYS